MKPSSLKFISLFLGHCKIIFLISTMAIAVYADQSFEDSISLLEQGQGAALANFLSKAKTEGEAAFPKLLSLLSHVKPSVRRAAFEALTKSSIKCESLKGYLDRALVDDDYLTRHKAISFVIKKKCSNEIESIKKLLSVESNDAVIKAALAAIGDLGTLQDVPFLEKIEKDATRSVVIRLASSRAIAIIGGMPDRILLVNSLRNDDAAIKESALKALAKTPWKDVIAEISKLKDQPEPVGSNAEIAEYSIRADGLSEESRKQFLLKHMHVKNARVRSWIAYELLINDPSPELINQIKKIAFDAQAVGQKEAWVALVLSGVSTDEELMVEMREVNGEIEIH